MFLNSIIKIYRTIQEIQIYQYIYFYNLASNYSNSQTLNRIRSFIFLGMINMFFIMNIILTLCNIFSIEFKFNNFNFTILIVVSSIDGLISFLLIRKVYDFPENFQISSNKKSMYNKFTIVFILLQFIWIFLNRYFHLLTKG